MAREYFIFARVSHPLGLEYKPFAFVIMWGNLDDMLYSFAVGLQIAPFCSVIIHKGASSCYKAGMPF